jgi:hypothetical protein
VTFPDFSKDDRFLKLRRAMGISDDYVGVALTGVFGNSPLTLEENESLRTGGIEVSFDEIQILSDGTIGYKDNRVFIYIRDVHTMGFSPIEPRYHLANCVTVQDMRARNRFERYVISTEITGTFKVNFIKNRRSRLEQRQLPVCRNCLDQLFPGAFAPAHGEVSRFTATLFVSGIRGGDRTARKRRARMPGMCLSHSGWGPRLL